MALTASSGVTKSNHDKFTCLAPSCQQLSSPARTWGRVTAGTLVSPSAKGTPTSALLLAGLL